MNEWCRGIGFNTSMLSKMFEHGHKLWFECMGSKFLSDIEEGVNREAGPVPTELLPPMPPHVLDSGKKKKQSTKSPPENLTSASFGNISCGATANSAANIPFSSNSIIRTSHASPAGGQHVIPNSYSTVQIVNGHCQQENQQQLLGQQNGTIQHAHSISGMQPQTTMQQGNLVHQQMQQQIQQHMQHQMQHQGHQIHAPFNGGIPQGAMHHSNIQQPAGMTTHMDMLSNMNTLNNTHTGQVLHNSANITSARHGSLYAEQETHV